MFTSAVGGDWNRAIRANRWRKIQVKCCSVECRLHRGPTVPFSSIEPHPISNKPSLNMLHPDPVVLTHRHQPPTYARCDQDPWIVPWEMIFPDPFIQIHNKSWRALFWAEIRPENNKQTRVKTECLVPLLVVSVETLTLLNLARWRWCLVSACVAVFLFGQKTVKFHFIYS